MSTRERLRSDLTKVIDETPCSYEVVIQELAHQIAWMYKAREDEHGKPPKITRRQILEGLKTLSDRGKL